MVADENFNLDSDGLELFYYIVCITYFLLLFPAIILIKQKFSTT